MKVGDQVLTLNLCCCHGLLASFSVATHWPLKSLAGRPKHPKLEATILFKKFLKVAHGNTIIVSPKICHQSSIVPYSTDNRRQDDNYVKKLINMNKMQACWLENVYEF